MSTLQMTNHRNEFLDIHGGGVRGVVHKSVSDQIEDWGSFARKLEEEEGQLLRQGGGQGVTSRKKLFGISVFCKIYMPDKLHRRLRDLAGRLRCMREWDSNCKAAEAGIDTAPILAAFAQVSPPLHTKHYFLTAPAAGQDLCSIFKAGPEEAEREMILKKLGGYVSRLHGIGFCHAHLNCPHIFMGEDYQFSLIDLERAFIRKPLHQRYIDRNLKQLDKSLKKLVSPEEREIFRAAYNEASASED